ncbi:MAG: hypothetical protein V2A67_01365 [Bacteroidota bacterium]
MKTQKHLRRRNFFRTIFGVFSLSGIMFTFQACYGTPQDFGLDVVIKGKVVSGTTLTGIPDIMVNITSIGQNTITSSDGTFSLYTERMPSYSISVSDNDGDKNGIYQAKDTVVNLPETNDLIDLQIVLN